jgi:hypothetical protein
MSDDGDAATDATTDETDADDALDPDELDPDEEHVRPLGDGRLLVSTDPDVAPDERDADAGAGTTGTRSTDASRAGPGGTTTGARATPDGLDGAYALVARARTGGETGALRVASDDVTEPFEALVRWYAGRVAPDVPPEEAVAVLLANSGLDVDVDVDAAVGSE